MTPRFVELEEFTVIGIAVDTTMEGNRNVADRAEVREKLRQRREEMTGIKDGESIYGVCWSTDATDMMKCRHVACYAVAPGAQVPEDMIRVTIPGGRYAVFAHRGPEQAINKTWEQIFRWMRCSGHNVGDVGVVFELFGEGFTAGDGSVSDIYIPVSSA